MLYWKGPFLPAHILCVRMCTRVCAWARALTVPTGTAHSLHQACEVPLTDAPEIQEGKSNSREPAYLLLEMGILWLAYYS